MSEQKENVASERQNLEFVAHGRGCVCGVNVRDKARGTERIFRVVELIHLAVGEYGRCGESGAVRHYRWRYGKSAYSYFEEDVKLAWEWIVCKRSLEGTYSAYLFILMNPPKQRVA